MQRSRLTERRDVAHRVRPFKLLNVGDVSALTNAEDRRLGKLVHELLHHRTGDPRQIVEVRKAAKEP